MKDKKTIGYAKTKEIKEMGLLDTEMGVVLGLHPMEKMPLVSTGPQHVLVMGPTRCGKGQNTVIPSCLQWFDSLVVLDFKGEIWAYTSGFRKNILKQKVLKFKPLHRGNPLAHWNPLAEIIRNEEFEQKDVRIVVRGLMGEAKEDSEEREVAESLLQGVILHFLHTSDASHVPNLGELADFFFAKDDVGLDKRLRKLPGDVIANFFSYDSDFRKKVFDEILLALELYRNPAIAENTSSSDFSLIDLIDPNQRVSLYVSLTPMDIAVLRPLLRLFVTMLCHRIFNFSWSRFKFDASQKKQHLLFLLDEFTELGRIENLEPAMSVSANYGVKFCLVCQDIHQLYFRYGTDSTIPVNTHIHVFFRPNPHFGSETAEFIAEELGVSQETVMTIHSDSVIVHMIGHNPIKAYKVVIAKAFMNGLKLPLPLEKSDVLISVK